MEEAAIKTTELAVTAGAKVSNDFTVWGMFWHADTVAKLVILILVICSVCVWAIIIDKYIMVKALNRHSDIFEDSFWSGESLEKLFDRLQKRITDPMTSVFIAGMREWRRAGTRKAPATAGRSVGGATPHAGLVQRIERVMAVCIGREMGNAERNMNFLATVGSISPFVGLFGTVWGIMNSFSAIAGSNNTSITVVAPGIAEALFTTALGLVAAIPAVVAFNKFNNDLSRYANRLDGFATEFSSILARHLEESEG